MLKHKTFGHHKPNAICFQKSAMHHDWDFPKCIHLQKRVAESVVHIGIDKHPLAWNTCIALHHKLSFEHLGTFIYGIPAYRNHLNQGWTQCIIDFQLFLFVFILSSFLKEKYASVCCNSLKTERVLSAITVTVVSNNWYCGAQIRTRYCPAGASTTAPSAVPANFLRGKGYPKGLQPTGLNFSSWFLCCGYQRDQR